MPFRAGIGVGGHCIPCDPHYLLWQLRRTRQRAAILGQAMDGIAGRPGEIVRRATETLGANGIAIRSARILVAGVTYKPGVDDVRESPALDVISGLRALGAHVQYADARVPSLQHDGWVMESVDRPEELSTDLVIVHVLHPGVDHAWLKGRLTLDPSGRAREFGARVAKGVVTG